MKKHVATMLGCLAGIAVMGGVAIAQDPAPDYDRGGYERDRPDRGHQLERHLQVAIGYGNQLGFGCHLSRGFNERGRVAWLRLDCRRLPRY